MKPWGFVFRLLIKLLAPLRGKPGTFTYEASKDADRRQWLGSYIVFHMNLFLYYSILLRRNCVRVYGQYYGKCAAWSTLGRWDGGKKGGMSLWRGWIRWRQSPRLAHPSEVENHADEIQMVFTLPIMKNGRGEVKRDRWKNCMKNDETKVWRKSKARSLKTQVSCLERMMSWWKVKMLKLRETTEMRTKQKGGLICVLCDSIHIWI